MVDHRPIVVTGGEQSHSRSKAVYHHAGNRTSIYDIEGHRTLIHPCEAIWGVPAATEVSKIFDLSSVPYSHDLTFSRVLKMRDSTNPYTVLSKWSGNA